MMRAAWEAEERAPFAGWDFSHLAGRWEDPAPPWDYLARAGELLAQSTSALDIGTGGGERLLALRAHWPARVVAMEDYPPNVLMAQRCLAPYGAAVVHAATDERHIHPFADGAFDLVLNRHNALHVDEVVRMLRPGGVLLTQQVHGLWAEDLLAAFGVKPQWPDATPDKYVPWLRAAGLRVEDVRTWWGALRFFDVGAVVYYLKNIPWEVPGFSVQRDWEALLTLQRQLERGQELAYRAGYYLIEARKP